METFGSISSSIVHCEVKIRTAEKWKFFIIKSIKHRSHKSYDA